MNRSRVGFTVVEIIIIIATIAILAAMTITGYAGWQRRVAVASVQSDLQNATSALDSYQSFSNDYPPNLGGVNYASSPNVALKLYTNAEQVRTYVNLSEAENAQLFINSCNALMSITSGSTTYNTSCSFAGQNIHIKGQESSNIVWQGPEVTQSDMVLSCGAPCDAAMAELLSTFAVQGGTFPIEVQNENVTLPPYTVYSGGPATRFCLEGVSVAFGDVVYHTTDEGGRLIEGPCPEDPELHYP